MDEYKGAPESCLERIAEAAWDHDCRSGKVTLDGVRIADVHQINSANHVYSGTIEHDGKSFGFIVEMGDQRGCFVIEWGNADDVGRYEPPPPVVMTFVPRDPLLKEKRPELFAVYEAWTRTEWFKEKERSYNYDRHFQPGGYVEKHYRDWAASKGMTVAVRP